MFDHVTIRVSDRQASRRVYETLLGLPTQHAGEEFDEWEGFSLAQADAEHQVTRNLHVAFGAHTREDVDAFWQRGVEAGYQSDGEPGPRPHYHPNYYGAFVLDPDGNSVEAVYRPPRTLGGEPIDHLWLGVADLEQSRRFWETVAPPLGLELADTYRPGHVSVSRGGHHFMLVADGRPPTENLHLAFPVPDNETVAEFHRVATGADYRDNGPPGERPQYHAGYFGAFVLDPDGNNIEAVNHGR
jgi:catechol 2,3-dioxygenase-like lactoylglutathione lyase family enzyme